VRTGAKLLKAVPSPRGLECTIAGRLGVETMIADRLVLATGYFDHPNALGVPGEQLPHVSHYFDEAHRSAGLEVVVIGGRNSAVETALQLFRAGAKVTLVYRGASLPASVKYWLKPDLENRIKAGEIAARFGVDVIEITDREVILGGGVRIAAERVYALTGYHPDLDLFSKIGIEFDSATGRPTLNPDTLEATVPGVYLAGSVTAGRNISEVFIENGRFDGEKIFGDTGARAGADERYSNINRPTGE
jgi:thioredoxin reductase (NADPH)